GIYRLNRKQVSRRSGIHQNALADAHKSSELPLEPVGEAAGGQPKIQCGIHQFPHFGGIEDLSRYRHGRFARHEGAWREGLAAVLSHQIENLLAQRSSPSGHIEYSRTENSRVIFRSPTLSTAPRPGSRDRSDAGTRGRYPWRKRNRHGGTP